MASRAQIDELFERGDASLVDELRRFHDADFLGGFAARWFADRRPELRRMLREYLSRPLNVYRHEVLVKRLFKMAEAANDSEIMGCFLVLFDRSLRRMKRRRRHYESRTLEDRATAQALLNQWENEGFETPGMYQWNDRFYVYGRWSEEVIQTPRGRHFWLFSVHTRNYLRRRAWRYFRDMGKRNPHLYVRAVSAALKQYEDADVVNGLALLDNWGLTHILFHHSPALVAKAHGWTLAPEHPLAELRPAPIYEARWQTSPRAIFDLLKEARCRPVRQWAIYFIRSDADKYRESATLDEWLALLFHEDGEAATLAAEMLREAPELADLSLPRWLQLLETPNATALEVLCELIVTHVRPERVPLAQAVRLACSRPLPLARLGFTWLQARRFDSAANCELLLGLTGAAAEALRPEMVRWLCGVLNDSPHFQPRWLLELLDSRHADVRGEGWQWLQERPQAREDVTLWQRLLESPYDDVRLRLAASLEERVRGQTSVVDGERLNAELLRFLWASVLLNVQRGGRTKPLVVTQIVRRLERKPDEARALLPILSVALRSVRGPEWRAGLAGIVGLVQRRPEMEAIVRQSFPDLKWL